jgi:S1-C subfamily serine protease
MRSINNMGTMLLLVLMAATTGSCAATKTVGMAVDLPHKSFMFVIKRITFSICNPADEKDCQPVGQAAISGSGFLVATNGKDTWGMTAGHVCINDEVALKGPDGTIIKPKITSYMRVMVLGGAAYEADIEEIHPTLDLCVVKIKGMRPNQLMTVAPDPPVRGEKHFAMAAPLGTFGPDLLPILEGTYGGVTMNYPPPLGGEVIPYAVYTIPTKGGSSGSPIVNAHGQLVGVTSGTLVGFESIAFSPPYEGVRAVFESVKKKAGKSL